MGFRQYRPGPALRDHVEYLWTFELDGAPDHAHERVLPTGTVELCISTLADQDDVRIVDPLAGERWLRGGIAAGCYTHAFEFDTRVSVRRVAGAHFRPGGAARLLGAPASELANAHVALTDLWGPSATELRERMCTATSYQQVALLEQALIGRLPDRPRHRPAVTAALAALDRPGAEVGQVARMLELSRRRFIEVFTEDVGMTPKRFAMVRRFQRALALASRAAAPAWSRIAAECGYYDQPHLCRDWLDITGFSPEEHMRQRAIPVNPNHVAIR